MRFSVFIRQELDAIIDEWESFAATLRPAANTMSVRALRDHSREILLAVAANMEIRESEAQRSTKSKGLAEAVGAIDTAASVHGSLRHLAGFDLMQLVAEFRAMRASVLSLWSRSPAVKAEAGPAAVEEITRFNEAIDQALAESVETYSAAVASSRDMLLAVLGPDLRSPHAGVKMTTALLARAGLAEPQRQQALLRIQRASATMDGLITDLMEYTRTRLGSGIPVERTDCDMGAVCDEALDAIRACFPERRFERQLSGDLRIDADVARMHQILSNLLNNAVQHGDRRQPVRLLAEGTASAVELSVASAGRPIPADALRTIFEPMVQAPQAGAEIHERSKTSMGLGLYIVREIAHGHGATVGVASTAESGTVFKVTLPRAIQAAPGPP